MIKFKENLKTIRSGKYLSQEDLGKKCGLGQSHISHFECGRRTPNIENLVKLSEALNCTLDELVK